MILMESGIYITRETVFALMKLIPHSPSNHCISSINISNYITLFHELILHVYFTGVFH